MNSETEHYENRLRELIKLRGLSKEELQKEYHISDSTLKSYLNGNRDIPSNMAREIAIKYGVTLDWLYCKTDFMYDIDIVLHALSKLLKTETKQQKVKRNGEIYVYRDRILYIDERLHNFLLAVQELEGQKCSSRILTPEEYKAKYEYILRKYSEELKDIFEARGFFEGKEVEIDSLELIIPPDKENSQDTN